MQSDERSRKDEGLQNMREEWSQPVLPLSSTVFSFALCLPLAFLLNCPAFPSSSGLLFVVEPGWSCMYRTVPDYT